MKKFLSIIILITAFNLNAQVWQVVEETQMPFPVYGGEAVVVDSLIYILGGFSDSLNTNINVIQEFNPQNNSWRIIDSMNTSRYGFVADIYQGNVVISGGIDTTLFLDSSLEIWNPNNPSSIFDLSLHFVRTYATGLINNNSLYMFGGVSADSLSTYMFEYNLPDSNFTFRNNFEFLLGYPFQQMSSYSENSIYLFGGVFIATLRGIYKYDVINRNLDLLQTELLQSRAGGKAVTLNDSLVYIIGGFNETMLSLSSVEIFNANNGTYTITNGPQLNFERSELMAVEHNNSIYVFGGKNDSNKPVRQIEKLDFATSLGAEDLKNYGPENFILFPNYPNPFNPSTNINFYLPYKSQVQIKIFNLSGEEIIKLVDEEMSEGEHNILFSLSNKDIPELSSGIYFYRLIAFNISTQNTYIATRKMLLLK